MTRKKGIVLGGGLLILAVLMAVMVVSTNINQVSAEENVPTGTTGEQTTLSGGNDCLCDITQSASDNEQDSPNRE